MKTKPILGIAILFLGWFWLFVPQAAFTQSPTGNVLLLSDIHFDPLADPKIVPDLVKKDVSQWKPILESSELFKNGVYPKTGEDTNYVLLSSAISAAAGQKPFDFVVFTGDFLRHDFSTGFKDDGLPQNDFPKFASKTACFVIEKIQMTFGVPVYAALGNNDSACDDYQMDLGGDFVKDLSSSLEILAANPEAAAEFRMGGFYELPHPTLPDVEIIVLNSVLWSPRFKGCKPDDNHPGRSEMEWLGKKLQKAKTSAKKVILIMHIPPGMDAYQRDKNKTVTPFWRDCFFERFLDLMESYGDIVQIALAGHTHMDDFRILGTSNASRSVGFRIMPSITSKFGNNPAFSVLQYSVKTGDIVDVTTFNLDLFNLPGSAKWACEYSFSQAYSYSKLTANNLAALAARIRTDQNVRRTFATYYAASAPSPVTSDTWQIYSCAQTQFTSDQFSSCIGNE